MQICLFIQSSLIINLLRKARMAAALRGNPMMALDLVSKHGAGFELCDLRAEALGLPDWMSPLASDQSP
jgi:hypothetical protein